jgi:hypothetical protein
MGRRSSTRRPLIRLTPDYDKRGHSPWHRLPANVPKDLDFVFFSGRSLTADRQPLVAPLMRERQQGDFLDLGGLLAANSAAVEVIRGLVGGELEALP